VRDSFSTTTVKHLPKNAQSLWAHTLFTFIFSGLVAMSMRRLEVKVIQKALYVGKRYY
jgi:hypothetical protein